MDKNLLMLGDVVTSPKDLKRMKVTEIKKSTVSLEALDGSRETSERGYDEIEPVTFMDSRTFHAIGFVDRSIRIDNSWSEPKVDRILQLIDPKDEKRFFTIIVEQVPAAKIETWSAKISDSNYQEIATGTFKYVGELQNLIRINTGLELKVINL